MTLSAVALDFMNNRCLASDPNNRPMAHELLGHPFITEYDPNWVFSGSKIGKAIAKKGAKALKRERERERDRPRDREAERQRERGQILEMGA